MKKILCAVLPVVMMLSGCASGSAAGVQIDPAAAARTLLHEGGLDDISTMSELTGSLADSFYALPGEVMEYAIYVDGSGATAREVAVLKVENSGDVTKAREAIDARLRTLAREFENYQPGEMQKINNPVISVRGNVAYLIITDNPQQAERAIDALYR